MARSETRLTPDARRLRHPDRAASFPSALVRAIAIRMQSYEDDYVARLVAHIRSQPRGACLLATLSNPAAGGVLKPPGVVGTLKALIKRRPEFILHDPQQGGGGETVSLAQAPGAGSNGSASSAADEYAARLLEHLLAVGGQCFLSHLGSLVPKPSHLRQSLKSIIEARPNMFVLEQGAGQAWTVRVAGAAEPEPEPGLANMEQVSRAFYDHVMADAVLRRRCKRRSAFTTAYQEWREAQRLQGRVVKSCPPATVIYVLSRVLKLITISSDTIKFKPAGMYEQFEQLRAQRENLEKDKFGVVVQPTQVRFDRIVALGTTDDRVITISTSLEGLSLQSFTLMRQDFFMCNFAATAPSALPLALRSGRPTSIKLTFKPSAEGMAGDVLWLSFQSAGGRRFSICRFVEARCGDADLHDDLKPSAPYQKPKRRRRPRDEEQGEEMLAPPERDEQQGDSGTLGAPQGSRLGSYPVNGTWKKLLLEDSKAAAAALEQGQQNMISLPADRAMAAYRGHFEKLLWTEEIQLHADLASFDLVEEKSTTLRRTGGNFMLVVNGLAEKRPSVLRGDTVWVTLPGSSKRWQGRAIDIQREEVVLHFHPQFAHSYIDNMRVEVRFVLGRRPLRIFYQGLTLTRQLHDAVLFPSKVHLLGQPPASDPARPFPITDLDRQRVGAEMRIVDPNVAANDEQAAAVRAVLLGEKRQVPYIIFGPPGTGKTTTVVELILQFIKGFENSKVLVCAPTNTAADVCCEKLGRIAGRMEMLRLMSYTRNRNEVPEGVRPFTQEYDTERRCYPNVSKADLLKKRVVVATLSMGGSLHNLSVERGTFDLIVIDEAGQAMEPEATACVTTLLAPDGQLVLSGDPKQLGPVIHHGHAKTFGLATSFLERLMSREVYARVADGEYSGHVLTKLVRNFRSHEELLHLPNELFYDGELVACADPNLRNSCLQWDGLLNPRVPMLFHGIEGKDDREGNSPSWFNADEAIQVLRYIESLLRMRQNRLVQEDIGVITPYNKQMQKISKLLKGQDLGGVKVGSTELFQGQERRVIIISCVRSNRDFIGFDAKHSLGFLDNPKRFNVALTRACSLLIIVGNPSVLAPDPHWGKLLRTCIEKSAYTGVPPPPAPGDDDGPTGGDGGGDGGDSDELLADRLAEMMLGASEVEVSHQQQQEGNEMPNWGQS